MRNPKFNSCLLSSVLAGFMFLGVLAHAKTVKVEMTAEELDLVIDNAGNKQKMWTFNGTIPGPLVRCTQGDTVDFTMKNPKENKNNHSMDFHAAIVDVLDEFAEVKPGDSKHFAFEAKYPGVFIYHCGATTMAEHISRGMYGMIIVDPKEGYSDKYPKPDREYVIVHGDLFEEDATAEDRTNGNRWKNVLVNGKVFHYDPVHDTNASLALESEPGERVRIYFVNAHVNDYVAFHPIAGIWDKVWDNGNPLNVMHGIQTYNVPAAHGVVFDIVSPSERDTNNAIVDHNMKRAMNGGITVLMNHKGVDPNKGRQGNLIVR